MPSKPIMADLAKPTALDYIYVILISLTFGSVFAFRTSLGTITDVIAAEFDVTSSGIGILSSSYWIAYMVVQIPWGLYLQVYNCQSALLVITFGLSICCLSFPFTSGSLFLGSIVFFAGGAITGCSFTVGIIFAGQRFGSNSISIVGGAQMITATAHNFIVGIIQAELYQRAGLWKPVYYVLAALTFSYGIAFLVCICCESNKQNDDQQSNGTRSRINSISFRKQSSALSSAREQDNMKLSMLRQLKVNMLQTIRMYLNWLSAVLVFCSGVLFVGIFGLWLVPYLMVKFDYSRSLSALIAGLANVAVGLCCILVGIASKRVKKRKIFLFVGCAFFASFVAFVYIDSKYLPLAVVIALVIVSGCSFSFFSPFAFTIVREYNWFYGNTETAISFVNMGIVAAAYCTQFAVGELLDYHFEQRENSALNEDENRIYTVDDFNFAFIIVPISLAVMLISICLLKETNGQNIDYANYKSVSTDGENTTTVRDLKETSDF